MSNQEFCQCGRYASKVHCPKCGCQTVYALASRQNTVTRSNGSTDVLQVYRCRRCAALFNDDQWQLECNAPPARLGRPADAVPRVQFTNVNEAPPEMQAALAAIKRARGIKD